MKKDFLSEQTVQVCRTKLLTFKSNILNQMKTMAADFNLVDKSRGDESDLSAAHQEEHNFLIAQTRMKTQLLEIEMALGRIESGNYGICEETDELIETERLLAIPWTRLSIEGAEIRESQTKKAGKGYLAF
ncbi:TraR/DksA family transcriptional regulator [Pseudobdellovibrio sp. HCB154]|uniref:TraR/DksA family transcriptional regulator n=1 Tax=Pseudobdellovibrio sp. HCB154 TaxID=3386277 RepID=UPI003916F117